MTCMSHDAQDARPIGGQAAPPPDTPPRPLSPVAFVERLLRLKAEKAWAAGSPPFRLINAVTASLRHWKPMTRLFHEVRYKIGVIRHFLLSTLIAVIVGIE